jgi:hypothetical protein
MIILPNRLKGVTLPSLSKKSGIILPTSRSAGLGKKPDLTTLEGLTQQAQISGVGKEAEKIVAPTNKLSFLQRLGTGLGAFGTAQAVLTGSKKGLVAGVGEYAKDIVQGLGSAISGKQLGKEKATYKDVVEQLGIHNSILKFGLGVAGDIFLDPTTYFGGAIAKGIGKGVGVVGKVAKVIPGVEKATEAAKGALGKGFVYGFGTSKGLPEKALEIQSLLAKTKEGIVASNLARLGTGVLSKGQQEELVAKLLAGKRAEFAVGKGTQEAATAGKLAAQSADPLVQKTIEAQALRSQKFAKQAGIQDPYEIYFPGLKNDTVKKFFEGTKQLRVGSEGYLKQFKNLLTDDQLIRNPAEAFARREFDIVKDSIIRSQIDNIVRDVGKPLTAFKTEEEAARAGFKVIKEKGIFGKTVGYLNEVDKKFIDNLISPEFTTIDAIAKATGFDAVTSLFKRSVTGLFAPFHIRNYVSGNIQNFEVLGVGALNPKNIASGQKVAWKLATGDQSLFKGEFGKAFKAFGNRFGTSSSYIADIGDATRGMGITPGKILSKESLKETLKTAGLGQQAIPFRTARAIGNYIETQQKATAFITALGQGNNTEKALTLAARAGFDYRALTGFESKILRRIIPFYSFMRKNVELQLRTLGENPQRINQVLKVIGNLGEKPSAEEKASLPDYLKNSLGIKISDTPEGLKQYISSFGTPIEAFTNLLNQNPVLQMLSQTNPLLKAPIEIGIGKDSFRQRDLKDVYDAREYKAAPQIIKDLLNIHEVQKDVLEKNRAGKLVKVGERTQYVADPVKLLIARSLFTSRGVTYLDQMFGGDITGLAKALKLTTGIKPQQIDIEMQKAIKEKEKRTQLEDLLLKTGDVKQFKSLYQPKY